MKTLNAVVNFIKDKSIGIITDSIKTYVRMFYEVVN